MTATRPAYSGATALVPTPHWSVAPAKTKPVMATMPATSGTPRRTPPSFLEIGRSPTAAWYGGSGNVSLTPPPVAQYGYRSNGDGWLASLHVSSSEVPRMVPPHAVTQG